jgi:hypothetical protein
MPCLGIGVHPALNQGNLTMTSFYLSRPGFAANSLKAILQDGDLVSVRLVPVDSTIAYGPELLPLLADDIKASILTECLDCLETAADR